MHARLTRFSVRNEQQSTALEWLDATFIPSLRQEPGFKGLFILNEDIEEEPGGEWLAITLWDTSEQAAPGHLGQNVGGIQQLAEQLKAVGIGLTHPRLFEVVRLITPTVTTAQAAR